MKTENIIAASSALVACLALGLTIWQGSLTRRHNRLSVRPHLVVETSSDDFEYEVRLTNNGLGPAVIKRIDVTVDGNPILEDKMHKFELLLRRLFKNFAFLDETTELSNNYVMAENECVKIMNLKFNGTKKPAPSWIKAQLNTVNLIIEYESFYKESLKLDTTENTRTFQ